MALAAGVLATLAGLGFGIPGVLGALYFAERGQVWRFMGFPTYGEGPFADHGMSTSVPLLLGFVLVCTAEVAVGVLLVGGWPAAWGLQFALLPFELAFWWGFALPFGFVLGLARVAIGVGAVVTER